MAYLLDYFDVKQNMLNQMLHLYFLGIQHLHHPHFHHPNYVEADAKIKRQT